MQISETARKWAIEVGRQTKCHGVGFDGVILDCIQSAIDEAKGTDPLPVMGQLVIALESAYQKVRTPIYVGELLDEACAVIAQLKRERGQTDAAEHVRKLKEAENEAQHSLSAES